VPGARRGLHVRDRPVCLQAAGLERCGYQVHGALGDSDAAFLDLQRLRAVDPGRPGLFDELQQAAAHALQQRSRTRPSQVRALRGPAPEQRVGLSSCPHLRPNF